MLHQMISIKLAYTITLHTFLFDSLDGIEPVSRPFISFPKYLSFTSRILHVIHHSSPAWNSSLSVASWWFGGKSLDFLNRWLPANHFKRPPCWILQKTPSFLTFKSWHLRVSAEAQLLVDNFCFEPTLLVKATHEEVAMLWLYNLTCRHTQESLESLEVESGKINWILMFKYSILCMFLKKKCPTRSNI